jgi:predicted transposase/invertase (TIGR01784 family)
MEYEKSLKAQRDLFAVISTAEEKAKQEGKIEGKVEGKIEVALKAIEKGFDNKTIQELTGLIIQEIERLRKKNK